MSSKFNEALAETNIADYNYLAKLEKISNQARSIRGKDLTLKRPVTEEIVKEYQKQFNKPVVVEEQDEFGNPVTKQYKYNKPTMEDTLEEYKPVEPELEDDDIEFITRDLKAKTLFIQKEAPLISETENQINDMINENNKAINEIEEERSKLLEEYNSIILNPYVKKKSKKGSQKQLLKALIDNLIEEINGFEKQIKDC
jgi:hypothetical protein